MSIFKDGVYYPLGCAEDMSEGEYQAMQAVLDNEDPPPALLVPAGRWRTREGTELELEDMTTEHIRNVIKPFTRAGWGDHMKIEELERELERRGTP